MSQSRDGFGMDGSRRRPRHTARSASGGRLPELRRPLALRFVDFGLLLAVFAVPMAFGGRQSIGQFLLILAACGSALSWAVYQLTSSEAGWVRSRVEPLLLAIVGVGLVQMVALPRSLLLSVSPAMADVLPVWFSGDGAGLVNGPWPYLSMSIEETRAGLALGIAYVLLFLVAVQRLRTREDVLRLLRWIGAAGALMAAFGLLQYLFSNGRFFWVFEHPQGTTADRPVGGFLNKNHFAHYLALCLGPLVWWCFLLLERGRQQVAFTPGQAPRSHAMSRTSPAVLAAILFGGVVLVGAALLLARSRGGILAAAVALTVMLFAMYWKSLITGRQLTLVSLGGVVMLGVVALFGERDLTRVVQRLDYWSDNGRAQIWQANLKIAQDFPVLGTGIGTHRYIYPRYLDQPFSSGEYTHAESSYLQILSETGLAGAGVMVVVLLVCLAWCVRGVRLSQDRETTIALCAISGSLVGACAHATADFVWYIPGCLLTLILLMACACRLYHLQRDSVQAPARPRIRPVSRPAFAMGVLALMPLSAWMISQWGPRLMAEPRWVEYRRLVLSDLTGRGDPAEDAADRPEDEWARIRFRRELVAMREAAKANPDDARFQIRLATHYETLFNMLQASSENQMALNQIRDAAVHGGFESIEEMNEWLDTAFGDNIRYARAAARHARRAIQLNPLEGYGYLYLTELGFLLGAGESSADTLLTQALTLRPYNGQVLFVAGRDALLKGDLEGGMDYWKQAFHRNEFIQEQIMHHLAQLTPAVTDVLVQQGFDPDIDALERLVVVTEELAQPVERGKALKLLAEKLTRRAQEPVNRRRSSDWLRAAWAWEQLGEEAQVGESLDRALEAAPSDFVVRLEYAAWKLRRHQSSEALEHLQWCQRMAPEHPRVRALMDQAMSRTAGVPSLRPSGADLQNRRF